MNLKEAIDGLSCLSLRTVALALRRPSQLRRYVSYSLKRYDELVGNGLPSRGPVTPTDDMTVTIPAYNRGGGMAFDELVILARAVRVLKPKTLFEMGTYDGLTTAVFMLNSESDSRVITLDLPPSGATDQLALSSDKVLAANRRLALVPKGLGLSRYTQLLCDSMEFDPTPYANSVDFGFIDAAHDLMHVQNDTYKMAVMMAYTGVVFWHDYGGKGALRPLAAYLENLAKRCTIYRIPGTSLAWGPAEELKRTIEKRAA